MTYEEFLKIKEHPRLGYDYINKSPSIKSCIKVIALQHHERIDGLGYPNALKGDEINKLAKIVSIADVYDALTNERVYKKAIPHEKAIEMIVTGECGQFNPMLIECLLEIKEDIPIQLMNAEYRNSWTPLDVWGGVTPS